PESALRAGPAAAPVRERGTGPQRCRRGLPDQDDRPVGGDRAPGRAAAPPREFGQSDEDESDVVRVRRPGGGGRSASRKSRGRSGAEESVRRGRAAGSGAKAGHRRLLLWLWAGVAGGGVCPTGGGGGSISPARARPVPHAGGALQARLLRAQALAREADERQATPAAGDRQERGTGQPCGVRGL